MRQTLWASVRGELASAEEACRAVLTPHASAIDRLAVALEAAGSLSGRGLIDALETAGAVEAAP